jgi:ribose transport system ATP-binding protein
VTKEYPGVRALDDVTFALEQGEVHALVGENGAGKSTLMKILAGAISTEAGRIMLNGAEVRLDSPADAQRLGIGVIYQDFKLVPELSAAENILLGHEPSRTMDQFIDDAELHRRARALLDQLGESFDARIPVKDLSAAQRQMVEIAKALSRNVRVLVMDEPTAPLTERETERLFSVVRALRSDGVSIIYISHRLEEIFEIADRITVLRDGKVVTTCMVSEATPAALIRWMVGREVSDEYPRLSRERSTELLRVDRLRTARLRDVSFTLHRGEILGIAGLVGAGRTDLARAIFGADPLEEGEVILEGIPITIHSPHEAISAGIGLLTEDRNQQGLFLLRNIRENITISDLRSFRGRFLLDRGKERSAAAEHAKRLRIKSAGIEADVDTLSGGNRQKVVLARWLQTHPRVLIFDEPTVGIDVGVKYEIYVLINELVREDVGVIVISSDLPELLGLCDRVLVLCDGRVSGTLDRSDATKERVLSLATAFN